MKNIQAYEPEKYCGSAYQQVADHIYALTDRQADDPLYVTSLRFELEEDLQPENAQKSLSGTMWADVDGAEPEVNHHLSPGKHRRELDAETIQKLEEMAEAEDLAQTSPEVEAILLHYMLMPADRYEKENAAGGRVRYLEFKSRVPGDLQSLLRLVGHQVFCRQTMYGRHSCNELVVE